MDAPQKIVAQFFDGGLLERDNLARLRTDAPENVPDHAVFAGGVHSLQNDQQRPLVFGNRGGTSTIQRADVLRRER